MGLLEKYDPRFCKEIPSANQRNWHEIIFLQEEHIKDKLFKNVDSLGEKTGNLIQLKNYKLDNFSSWCVESLSSGSKISVWSILQYTGPGCTKTKKHKWK